MDLTTEELIEVLWFLDTTENVRTTLLVSAEAKLRLWVDAQTK